MHSYMTAMRRYVEFSGRSTRSEFWLFVLFYFILAVIATILDFSLGSAGANGVGFLSGIIALVHIIPSISVSVRRLHDTDRSGWWILISFIPLIGAIWLLVLYCLEGTPGANRFGLPDN